MDTLQTNFLTSSEVIKLLRISKSTLHRWIEKGNLKAYRTGKKLKFKYKDILEIIKEYSADKNIHEEKRINHIKSLRGKYRYINVTTEDYIKRKLEDIEQEGKI